MAALDIVKTSARITHLLLAQAAGDAFLPTVGDERYRTEEIYRSAIETESEVIRVLAESYHPLRVDFLKWSNDLSHGVTLPKHIGTIEAVRIKPTSVANSYKKGREVVSASEIEDWRDNAGNVFGEIAHDAANSPLSCYYRIENQTIYFTGHRAQVKFCDYAPNFAQKLLQIDDSLESAVVCGAVARLLKDGTSPQIAQYYSGQFQGILNALRGGMRQIPELQEINKSGN